MTLTRLPIIFFAATLLMGAVKAFGADESCSSNIRADKENQWKKLSQGLEVRDFNIRIGKGSSSMMAGVRLDPNQFRIHLHWQTNKGFFAPGIRQLAKKMKAVVVLNAGYFDEKGRPLGYFKSGDKVYNSRLLFRGRRRALHLGAVFYVLKKSGKAGIVTREAFNSEGVQEAFQAGPYLVRKGKPDPGLDAYREFRRPDRRTILAIGKDGRLIFLVSEEVGRGISWCELQHFLTRPVSKGGLDAAEAMNLDGGSSSQLYVEGNKPSRQMKGRIVPALIVVVPR